MATYNYKCDDCGNVIEVKHSMLESPDIFCDVCETKMRKHLTPETTGMSRRTGDGELSDWEEVKYRRHG